MTRLKQSARVMQAVLRDMSSPEYAAYIKARAAAEWAACDANGYPPIGWENPYE